MNTVKVTVTGGPSGGKTTLIEALQKELEDLIYIEHQPKLLVCDRGSMDALAYWPESPQSFFEIIQSTVEHEYSRYDWVLHLDTAATENYDSLNPLRIESPSEAHRLNQRILGAWEKHPRRIRINQKKDFLSKMAAAHGVIQAILNGESVEQIRKTFE